jgi:hypothetical protein
MKRTYIQGQEKPAPRCVWTKFEDKALKAAVKQYKHKGWSYVASYVNSFLPRGSLEKNSNQCRERWSNQLNPEVSLESLNKAEIELIFSLHKKLGNRWSAIANKLPGRTDNAVKNWFLCKLRKLTRCIKKESVSSELPKDLKELEQKLYMLDYLYKYYLCLDRSENIAKSINSQTKKRKNAGDKYINQMVNKGSITIHKLSIFAKSLLSEVRFSFDKTTIKTYEHLWNPQVSRLDSECSYNQVAVNSNIKSETVISTTRNIQFNILAGCIEERVRIELPLPDFTLGKYTKLREDNGSNERLKFDFAVYSLR